MDGKTKDQGRQRIVALGARLNAFGAKVETLQAAPLYQKQAIAIALLQETRTMFAAVIQTLGELEARRDG